MAGAADGNAGGKIQEPIAINVPNFDTATMRHHERVLARIRGRYYFGIARWVRSPFPLRKPALVQKSSFATKLRGDCFSTTKIFLAWSAISGAPPAPGSRVFGLP